MSVFEQSAVKLEDALLRALDQDGPIEATVDTTLLAGLSRKDQEAGTSFTGEEGKTKDSLTDEEKKILEYSICRLMLRLMGDAVKAKASMMTYTTSTQPSIPHLLDVTLFLSNSAICEPGVIFAVLEQLSEGSTISDCQEVFTWVESKTDMLRREHLWKRGKLIMLRLSNEILRRLSKANDTVFCGRILMLLAHLFPLSERSALNLQSKSNIANVTKIEEDYEEAGGAGELAGPPVDRGFHKSFWGLQEVFLRAAAVLDPATWATFHAQLAVVLGVFEKQPLHDSRSGSGLTPLDKEDTFCVKYLTSSRLLHLQLKDPAFRRHFLIQCLTLLHYCLYPPKEKDAVRGKQAEEVHGASDRVEALLEATPPQGAAFTAAIRTILKREDNWVLWKRDSCPVFERAPVTEAETASTAAGPPAKAESSGNLKVLAARKKIAKKVDYRVKLGNSNLDRLWSLSDSNKESCSLAEGSDRAHMQVPKVEDFMACVVEEMDPENGFEEEYKHKNDKLFCWKANRLIARTNLSVFSKMPENLEEVVPLLFGEDVLPKANAVDTNDGEAPADGEAPGADGQPDVKPDVDMAEA